MTSQKQEMEKQELDRYPLLKCKTANKTAMRKIGTDKIAAHVTSY